jgi:hypothetical protein
MDLREEYQILDNIISDIMDNMPNGIRNINERARSQNDHTQQRHYNYLKDEGIILQTPENWFRLTPKGVFRYYKKFVDEYDREQMRDELDRALKQTQVDNSKIMSALTGVIALCTILQLWQSCNSKPSHSENTSCHHKNQCCKMP